MTTRRAQIRITASRSPARGVQTGGNELPEADMADALVEGSDAPSTAAGRVTRPASPQAAAALGREEARNRALATPTGLAPPVHAPERLGGPRGIGFWPLTIRRAYEDGYRAEVAAQRRVSQVLREVTAEDEEP